ncbi:YgaP family membrane protein [Mariniphaga sediminis]|uniref:YgaP family membrane protein n=1 Tax=Mariniphaga sediminis TaxID=1628158 RepID=UPI00356AEB29
MKRNMGSIDRGLRVLIAALLVVLYLTGKIGGTLGVVLLILAVVFLLTSLLGICPLYYPLGLKTNKKAK